MNKIDLQKALNEKNVPAKILYIKKTEYGDYEEYGRWLFVCEHVNRLDYECENCRNHIQTINEPDYILAYKRCPNCGAIMEVYKKRIL